MLEISPNMQASGNAPRPKEVDTERQRWRESLLNGVFWSCTVMGALISAVLLQQHVAHRSLGAALVSLVAFILILVARRIHFRVRATVLIGAVFAACTVGLGIDGFTPESLLGLAFSVTLSTMLLGRTAGFATCATCVLAIVSLGYLHSSNLITRPPDWWQMFDTANADTAARVVLVFSAVSVAIVVGMSHLIERTETLLREKDLSLRLLQESEEEREGIRKRLDQSEREFRRARELEALGRLAGFAAHDFNNTLYIIAGNAEIARRTVGQPEEFERALRAIEVATREATSTSRQLLAFGASGSKRKISVDPKAEVERAGVLLQRILSCQIQVQVETTACPQIETEEGAIQRILMNLALNARDAMPEGGTLRIGVRPASESELPGSLAPSGESYIQMQVEDDGCGMDQATIEQLFEPFFTTKGPAGSGLGLSSVQSLAQAAGGLIQVESKLGEGTCFRLYWPTEERARIETARSTVESVETSLQYRVSSG